jgi:O-antigen/teichoic acid export membrane protein
VVTLCLSAVSVPLIWLGSDWLAQVTQMPGLTHILWLLPATMLMAGIAQFLNYWSVYRGTFRLNASSRVVQAVLQSALQVVLGAIGAGPVGLVLGYAVAYGIRAANFILRLPRRDWGLLYGARAAAMRRLAIEEWRYPVLSAPSTLLQNGTQLLPAVLLAALYGPAVAGWFGLGQRLIGLPVRLLGQAASQVFLGEIAISSKGDSFKLFKRASMAFLVLGVIIMAPLLLAGPSLFALVFGETWRTAGEITRYLVPLYLTRLVVTPVSQTLNAYGRQSQHLLTAGLDTGLLATSFAIAWQYSLEPLTTVLMFSVGSSLAYLLYFWLAFKAARSLARAATEVQPREPAIDPLL